jgi:hypothetical protein
VNSLVSLTLNTYKSSMINLITLRQCRNALGSYSVPSAPDLDIVCECFVNQAVAKTAHVAFNTTVIGYRKDEIFMKLELESDIESKGWRYWLTT